MSKNDLHDIAKILADKYNLSIGETKRFTNVFIELVNEGLQEDGHVKIKGLGTFKIIDVKDRESINVTTGERILIPGRSKISFTPDSVMKELVNKPFSQFDTVILNDGVDFSDLEQQTEEITDNEEIIDEPDDESFEESIEKDSVVEESTTEESITEEPISEESIAEEPISEESISEEIVTEEPVIEESITEEPVIEEPTEVSPQHLMEDSQLITNKEPLKEDNKMKHRHSRRKRVAWWIPIGFLLSLAAGIAIGYHIGIKQVPAPLEIVGYETDSLQENAVEENLKATEKESDKTVVAKEEKKEVNQEPVATSGETKAEENKPAKEPVTIAPISANDSQVLRNAKQMVSKGAYSIVGTMETVTVRPGQTMKKISKFYLGDGMECYIQAYNNIEEVTEGMKLKIPQVKLKKK